MSETQPTSRDSISQNSGHDESVERILRERYYLKDSNGEYETWEKLCTRVGTTLEAQAPFNGEYTKDELISAIKNRRIMFGSPTLMNANARHRMLSSCFIFSLGDSLESIFDVVKDSARTFQHGGGIGYDFSCLRPEGAEVKSTGGYSSGPISFMKVIDTTGEVVKGGGLRKAAIMSTMRIDHPDVEQFINIKRNESELNNMNLSVTISDEFMEALANDSDFNLRFDGKVYKTVKAKYLWDLIVDAAWLSAEPGVIFIDKVNKYNTTPAYGPITHPNPCSEFFQVHWNSCNLGSVNLMGCYDSNGQFDFGELSRLTRLLTVALNKTIEINNFPTEKIEAVTKALRPIGIGVFGTANVFIKEKLVYGSPESCDFLEKVLDTINRESLDLSADYAEKLGKFDTYDYSNILYLRERENDPSWASTITKIKKHGLYNCLTTTLMPTGTVSILAGQGESNGIEPLYSRKVTRKYVGKGGDIHEMDVFAPAFNNFYLDHSNDTELPDYLITKDDLTPEDHINVLAAAQRHCQTGVSKTVNFPASATRQDISDAYLLSYQKGCKSVSVYRDGSRTVQILNSSSDSSDIEVKSYLTQYDSKTVPGMKVMFDITRTKSGKILGIIPKTEAGEQLTIGGEASRCALITSLLRHSVAIDDVLKDLKPIPGQNDLTNALFDVLDLSRKETDSSMEVLIKRVESSPKFGDCPTGVCSI